LLSCAHDEQERRLQEHQVGEKHPPANETPRRSSIAAGAAPPGKSHAETTPLSVHFLLRFALRDAIIGGFQIGRQMIISTDEIWQMREKFLV